MIEETGSLAVGNWVGGWMSECVNEWFDKGRIKGQIDLTECSLKSHWKFNSNDNDIKTIYLPLFPASSRNTSSVSTIISTTDKTTLPSLMLYMNTKPITNFKSFFKCLFHNDSTYTALSMVTQN